MTKLWFGPSGVPSKDSPEEAISALQAGGYTACEIDFERGFWMDKDWAARFGQLARDAGILLSVHAPLAAFMGHADKGKKFKMALGMLDHTAGLAALAGADPVVIHPGFLLGRERGQAIDDVVDQLGELRERLEGKGRAVPFGIEVMGRVRELGTAEDCFNVASRVPWVRPVLDFAHLHAVTDGAFTNADAFAQVLRLADQVMQPNDRIHIHFSDIAYANQNETKHLPYGEGTLRADPLGEALATIDRPVVVISESPDEASHQQIRSALFSNVAAPTA
jgi:deoxyribonuclease-4